MAELLKVFRVADRLLEVEEVDEQPDQPGEGALFLTNGRPTGKVPDPAFARLFFGIWLAGDTSEPAMRTALLSGLGGS